MQIDRAILTIISINVLSCYLKPDVVIVSAIDKQQRSSLAGLWHSRSLRNSL